MKSEGNSNFLTIAQILQVSLITAVFIYFYILIGFIVFFDLDSDMLNFIAIILAIISIADLVFCYYLPRFMAKGNKSNPGKSQIKIEGRLLSLWIVRSSMLEAMAIFGLILGIIGANLYIVLPFF
jgi:hypothetical protein